MWASKSGRSWGERTHKGRTVLRLQYMLQIDDVLQVLTAHKQACAQHPIPACRERVTRWNRANSRRRSCSLCDSLFLFTKTFNLQ